MEIEEVRENLRSGRDIVTDLPLSAARREVSDLKNSTLAATVRGLLSILAVNTRQIDRSTRPKLDAVAEGGRFTKACIDAVVGVDPEYPGFTQAGQTAEAIHESGKLMLQQADAMKVCYGHARVFLERALNSLDEAALNQDIILSELAATTGLQAEVLHNIETLDPGL